MNPNNPLDPNAPAAGQTTGPDQAAAADPAAPDRTTASLAAPGPIATGPVATEKPPAGGGGRRVWRVVGAAFSVLVIAAGVLTVVRWMARQTETQHQVYHQRVSRIVVEISTGDLTLRAGEDGVVDVQRRLVWYWSKPKIDESWDGETLIAHSDCDGIDFGCGGVDYSIRVPRNVEVDVQTSTGDLQVHDIAGKLRVSTNTGDITVRDARDTVWMRTSTGDIEATGLDASDVEARTSTGDVGLSFAGTPNRVSATTSTGDINIDVPRDDSYDVTSEASTGDVNVDVTDDPDASRTIDARTSTGDVDVHYH